MDLQAAINTTNQYLKNAFKNMTDEMQISIQNCSVCHQVCVQTMVHCIEKGGAHVAPEHLKQLIDCAEICSVSANFMTRNAELYPSVCRICADICESCATSCEQLGGNDDVLESCAEICRRCAESCQKMAVRH